MATPTANAEATSTQPRGAGPLTTVFSTPDFCRTGYWTDTVTPPLRSEICMPPKFHSYYDYHYGFYSPGICPAGYSEGCAFPASLATTALGTPFYGGPLLQGESARVCCPTGYECYTSGALSESFWSNCISTVPLTSHWQYDYGKDKDVMTTVEALAYAIQVRWQASDLSILATDPTAPGSTYDGPQPTSTAESGGAASSGVPATGAAAGGGDGDGGSPGGVSTGTLIALAVAVPLASLALGLAAFLLWRRNYRKKHGRGGKGAYEGGADGGSTVGGGSSSSTRLNHELLSPYDGGARSDTPNTGLVSPLTPNTMFGGGGGGGGRGASTTELDSHTVNEMDARSVYEADSKPRQLVEMEADSKQRQLVEMEAAEKVHEMPHTFVAELDGTPVDWRRVGEVAAGHDHDHGSNNNNNMGHLRQRSLSRAAKPPPLKKS